MFSWLGTAVMSCSDIDICLCLKLVYNWHGKMTDFLFYQWYSNTNTSKTTGHVKFLQLTVTTPTPFSFHSIPTTTNFVKQSLTKHIKYSETSNYYSCMPSFPESIIHFLWYLNTNNVQLYQMYCSLKCHFPVQLFRVLGPDPQCSRNDQF